MFSLYFQSCLQTDAAFTCSDAAHNPLLARKTPAVCPEPRRSLTLLAVRQHSPSLVPLTFNVCSCHFV